MSDQIQRPIAYVCVRGSHDDYRIVKVLMDKTEALKFITNGEDEVEEWYCDSESGPVTRNIYRAFIHRTTGVIRECFIPDLAVTYKPARYWPVWTYGDEIIADSYESQEHANALAREALNKRNKLNTIL